MPTKPDTFPIPDNYFWEVRHWWDNRYLVTIRPKDGLLQVYGNGTTFDEALKDALSQMRHLQNNEIPLATLDWRDSRH